jgi:hypothetical protein
LRFLLGDVDLIIGGGVEDDLGVDTGERALDGGAIGDIDLGAGEAGNRVSTRFQLGDQFDGKLPGSSENNCFAVHFKPSG